MARFEAFWQVACEYRDYLWLGVMLMVFFLVLGVFSLLLAPRGSGSFAIAVVDVTLVVLVGGAMFGMFWVCQRREAEY